MRVPDAILRLLAGDAVVDLATGEERSPDADTTALLAFLSSVIDVRTMVEVGSSGGVTAGAFVAGHRGHGIVTSVEADRDAHDEAHGRLSGPISEGKVRLMHGDLREVLGRLTDGGYGLALLQHDPRGYDGILDEVVRLLVPSGIVIARRVLDPEAADDVAPFLQRIAELTNSATVLDLDGGLLLARLA